MSRGESRIHTTMQVLVVDLDQLSSLMRPQIEKIFHRMTYHYQRMTKVQEDHFHKYVWKSFALE